MTEHLFLVFIHKCINSVLKIPVANACRTPQTCPGHDRYVLS